MNESVETREKLDISDLRQKFHLMIDCKSRLEANEAIPADEVDLASEKAIQAARDYLEAARNSGVEKLCEAQSYLREAGVQFYR